MPRQLIKRTITWLKRVVTQPRSELSRWQKAARFGYDLARHGGKQLWLGRAPQMAAALAFRSLFAMLPVVVVATVVVKGARGTEDFKKVVSWLINALGLRDVQIVPPDQMVAGAPAQAMGFGQWLEDVITKLADVNLQALGWVGLALVIYSAIAVMVTIENSFNAIYGAPSGRSWTRRVPLYWFILTIGPIAMGITVVVDARVESLIQSLGHWQLLLSSVRAIWSFCTAWLLMFAVYKLVPNTIVAIRPALAGAFVAAVLLVVGKNGLGIYFERAFSFSYLYGTLGLIPVFMFWVYVMWLVVLFGLELSSILQTVQGRSLEDIEPQRPTTGLVDPAAVVSVMQVAAEQFQSARTATIGDLCQTTGLPEPIVSRIVTRLIQGGYLHRLEGPESSLSLAQPPERISADQLIEIGFELVDAADADRIRGRGHGRLSPLLLRLRDVQMQLAAESTLATLLSAPLPPPAAGRRIKPQEEHGR